MLADIKASLIEAICTSDEMGKGTSDKATLRWKLIKKFLETHAFIMNADVRALFNVSAATSNRILYGLVAERNLIKYHRAGHWVYKINR